jgi:protein involved in sex pheromone biosynthesis
MKKQTLVLLAIILSGCSNVQNSNNEESLEKQTNDNKVCKKISRHKSVIKRCIPAASN